MFDSTTSGSYSAVTPHDANDVSSSYFRGLYIGVSGDVAVVPPNATAAVVFKAVPVGPLNIMGRRVNSTGTTATDIVALF